MDATPSLDYSALLVAYDKARWISAHLTTDISEKLDGAEINEAGHRLGLLRQNVLILTSETEMAVVSDFAMRHLYRDGKNAIERYPEIADRSLASAEFDALGRMAVARYRVLDIDGVERGVGLMVTDRLRCESGLLVDRSFSTTALVGDILACNVVEWDGYWAGTGAGLPMEDRDWARLERPINKRFGKPGKKYRNLDAAKHADLAAWCTRACLDAGMARRVIYRSVRPVAGE